MNALTGGKGMPVMGGFSNGGNGIDGANGLGHPGIMNSIMSYGLIRNMPFTEMELAAFQDMGYAFDRSQYFGKSYYYEVGGNTQTNMRGFGTAAAPNTTLFGLGTHILRDNLTLTQQGDIYANGYGGGVRIDGVGNTLFLSKGVTVAADGTMGTGLLVSYGSKNAITLRDVDNPLHNAGTIAPGNSIGGITINGGFTNSGVLAMEFDGKGSTDTLVVTGAFVHNGSGTVSLSPVQDYYNGSLTINTANMFQGGTGSNLPTNITAFTPAASPTLDMNMVQSTPGAITINTTRPADAYSQYATSGNGARVGSALLHLSGAAQGDMRDMLAGLDFSAADGSGVAAALPQLTAASYAQAAQASTEANLGIGRMALAHLRATADEPAAGKVQPQAQAQGLSGGDSAPQWSAFVMPFGGGSMQQAHADASGYNSSQAGLMGGVYRQTEEMRLSLYSAFSRRQADMWTAAGAQARGTALHVGGSALWSADSSGAGSGWQVWGQAQLGVENTDMRRSVEFAGYARQNSSSYTSFNGVAQLGGAYLWRADAFSFGPKAGLEYAFNALPAIIEEKGGASRLGIDAYTLHDLRGVAGITGRWSADMGEGRKAQAHLDVAWRQDMLSKHSDMQAHFVGYDQYSFANRVEREGQGSLGLTGGVDVSLRQDVTLSALVEADVLRPGYNSVSGGLSLRWDF